MYSMNKNIFLFNDIIDATVMACGISVYWAIFLNRNIRVEKVPLLVYTIFDMKSLRSTNFFGAMGGLQALLGMITTSMKR
jgi:hypothetical protein